MAGFQCPMFTGIHIEALLDDEELADQIWEVWDAGIITDELAAWAWLLIATQIECGIFCGTNYH